MKKKKLSIEETEKVMEQRKQELKDMIKSANIPAPKTLGKQFIDKLLLEYLEACDYDASRMARKQFSTKGDLNMFNFSRKMILREIIAEFGYEKVMNELDRKIMDYQFAKHRKEPSKFDNLKYKTGIFVRRHFTHRNLYRPI